MIKSILIQAPAKFYHVVPIFWKEANKFGIFDKFYIATDEGNIWGLGDNCHVINLKTDFQFSGNMLRALDEVEEEVFIVCCEDHIMTAKNEPKEFDKCFQFFEDNPLAGYLRLNYHDKVALRSGDEGFIRQIKRKYKYYISLQPSVWRKEYFRAILRDGEDAWSCETEGAERAKLFKGMHSFSVTKRVFWNTNFLREGKYYRHQYVDYALKNGINIMKQLPVYYRKRVVPFDVYLSDHANKE